MSEIYGFIFYVFFDIKNSFFKFSYQYYHWIERNICLLFLCLLSTQKLKVMVCLFCSSVYNISYKWSSCLLLVVIASVSHKITLSAYGHVQVHGLVYIEKFSKHVIVKIILSFYYEATLKRSSFIFVRKGEITTIL